MSRITTPTWARVTLTLLLCAAVTRMTIKSASSVGHHEEARVAYFIQVGSSNVHLLPRLMNALYDAGNAYALHYDLKIPREQKRQSVLAVHRTLCKHATDGAYNLPNLYVVPSEPITYRGITMTLNYLTGMSFLLERDGAWDFFINLSAADYPTASQRLIRRLLALSRGRNFVEWKPPVDWAGFADRRLGDYYIDTALAQSRDLNESHYLSLDGAPVSSASRDHDHEHDHERERDHEHEHEHERRRMPPPARNPLPQHLDYTIAKSSGWLILSHAFCESMQSGSFARKVTSALSYSDASDEHLFATVLWNGAAGGGWRATTVGANMRSIFFVAPNGSFALGADGRTRSRQHPFWVDEVDEEGDFLFWDELWMKRPGFFTRKVRDAGSGFRDRVDRMMIGLYGRSTNVAAYERRLEERFRGLVEVREDADVFGNTIDDP